MENVVSLAKFREERTRHLEGEAKCLDCKKTWEAAAPIGVYRLECPDCGTMRGVWNNTVGSSAGTTVFTCMECGNQAWELREDLVALCLCCGNSQVIG